MAFHCSLTDTSCPAAARSGWTWYEVSCAKPPNALSIRWANGGAAISGVSGWGSTYTELKCTCEPSGSSAAIGWAPPGAQVPTGSTKATAPGSGRPAKLRPPKLRLAEDRAGVAGEPYRVTFS